jgi:hypothetical protein
VNDASKSSVVLDREIDTEKSQGPSDPRIRCPLCGWTPAKKTDGFVIAGTNGPRSIREASARRACTSGLRPNVCRAAVGRRIPIGMHSDALTSGSKRRTAARAETTGCARASRRAFDSQPRGRSHSAVWCPARRRCALATRFRRWSVQRPSVTISNRKAQRSIRRGISKDQGHVASDLLKPYDAWLMLCHPIGTRINHVANDDEECSAPAELAEIQSRPFP